MTKTPYPKNEEARLKSLLSYGLMGTGPEEQYQELVKLACLIGNTPIGFISLIDSTHQWYKAKIGIELTQIPRSLAFCSHTILSSEMLEIPDAKLDPRFANNPAVTGSINLRHYAGFPLINEEGYALGTLCLLNNEPGNLSETQIKMLKIVANQVVHLFEQSRTQSKLKHIQEHISKISKMASLGEMAAGIAHEINNPLMVIIGKVFQTKRFIKKQELKVPEIEENILKIDETARRISKIVNGLRSFSRNSGSIELESIPLSILLNETLSLCEEKFRYHNIEFSLKVPKEDPIIECRSVQISQVLINLFNNAFDAIKNNEKKWLKLEVSKNKKEIKFKVIDSGNGIAPEVITKLMTPFFTTKEAGKGTGLGLSISRDIIKSHQGDLLYDTKNPHTCFIFTLPLKQS